MPEVSELNVRSTIYTLKDTVARDTKVDIDQGTEYAGKYLRVNDNGKVEPYHTIVSSVDFANITGDVSDNPKLKSALEKKVEKANKDESFSVGADALGLYVILT